MSTLGYILLFTFIGSIGGLTGGLILLANEKLILKISHFLASFAAGILLGTAFFDLMPEAIDLAEKTHINALMWTLVGIVLFFLIERSIHWFHHHEEYHEHKEKKSKTTVPLIVIGDTIHNFVDGVVMAATFMVSIPLGIVTTIAVTAHEIPQEIGDFGLMMHRGLSRKKVILVNVVSACAAFAGAILTYLLGGVLNNYLPIFIAVTAGFFIYIAASDLIPEIHYERRQGFALVESLLLIFGIVLMYISVTLLEHGH